MVASRITMNCATAISASTALALAPEAGRGAGEATVPRSLVIASRSSGSSSVAVTAAAEFVDESRMGRRPIELGPSLGRVRPLIEQQDLGEFAQACPSLILGTRDRSRGAGCDGGRLGQLRNGRVQSIADDVVTAGRVVLQSAPEDIRQVRDVDRGPVLTPGAEHDQLAGVVTG